MKHITCVIQINSACIMEELHRILHMSQKYNNELYKTTPPWTNTQLAGIPYYIRSFIRILTTIFSDEYCIRHNRICQDKSFQIA